MNARPDISQAFAHVQALAPGPAEDTVDKMVAAIRAAMVRYGDASPRTDLPGVRYIACEANGVPCEWIVAEDARVDERVVHIHGGSLVAGSPRSHRAMLSVLAQASRRPVLCIDYRLAPEHPYPAAHEDCRDAFNWALANGPSGVSPARTVVLCGDSSGAAVAIATCAEALVNKERLPDCLVLMSPTLLAAPYESRPDRESDPLINNAALGAIALYADGQDCARPPFSPLNYGDDVLARLPPALLQVGAGEFVLYDSLALAGRLAQRNRRAVVSIYPDVPHVWHHFTTHLPEAPMALLEAARFIDESCATAPHA